MKRGGGLHPAGRDWWPPTKRPQTTSGGLIAASVRNVPRREGVPPCAHGPSFGRNPRGSPDFLAYSVPKAYRRHRLGTWVPRCLGVAHSASRRQMLPKGRAAVTCALKALSACT